MAGITLITSFVLAILTKPSISSIPGLPHYSLQQQSILSEPLLKHHSAQKQIIYVPVPVCGACHSSTPNYITNPCPQIKESDNLHQLNYHQQIASANLHLHQQQLGVSSGYAQSHQQYSPSFLHEDIASSVNQGSSGYQNVHNSYNSAGLAGSGLSSASSSLNHHGGKLSVSYKQNHHHHGGGVSQQSVSQIHDTTHHSSSQSGFEDYSNLSEEELHKKHKNAHYRFEYAVNDQKTRDVKKHVEERDGDVVKGEYSLVEDDGNVRTVKYYADWKTGFHAQVHNSKPKPLG